MDFSVLGRTLLCRCNSLWTLRNHAVPGVFFGNACRIIRNKLLFATRNP